MGGAVACMGGEEKCMQCSGVITGKKSCFEVICRRERIELKSILNK